jgi:toxin ParE1/3/4
MAEVFHTEDALQDLDEIWVYMSRTSPERASEFIISLDETLTFLAEFPYLGRERKEWRDGLRSTIHKGYVVIYYIIEGGVLIERIIYGSRDIEGLFRDE